MAEILNKILINGQSKAYGGYPYSCSFSAEFGTTSGMSVDFISDGGVYKIDQDRLSTERGDKISIPFSGGYKEIWMLPTKLEKTNSPNGKILRVNYIDYSKIYLDKHLVLIYGKHGYKAPSRVLLIGTFLKSDGRPLIPPEVSELTWELAQQYEIKYKFSDLLRSMINKKIPMSSKLLALVIDPALDIYREFSGTLREVLTSWATELNLMFYWDCFGTEGVNENKIGYLEVLDLSKESNVLINIKNKAEELEAICSATSSSNYYTIDNNFSHAMILSSHEETTNNGTSRGYVEMYPLNLFNRGGKSLFLKDIFGVYHTFKLRTYDKDGKTETPVGQKAILATQDEIDILELLRAAALGPVFYRYFVLLKLMIFNSRANPDYSPEGSLTLDNIRSGDLTFNETMNPKPDATTIALLDGKFATGESWNVNKLGRNLVLEKLYGAREDSEIITKAAPIYFSESFTEADFSARMNSTDINIQNRSIMNYIKKNDKKFFEYFTKSIKSGIMVGAITINKYLYNLYYSTEKDIVFLGLQNILNYGDCLYFSDRIITEKNNSTRTYSQNVNMEYAGLASIESVISDLFMYKYKSNLNEVLEKEPKLNNWSISLDGETNNWKSSLNISDHDTFRNQGEECEGYSNIPSVSKIIGNVIEIYKEEKDEITQEGESCSKNGYEQANAKRRIDPEEIKPNDLDYNILYIKDDRKTVSFKQNIEEYEIHDFQSQNSFNPEDDTQENVKVRFYAPFNARKLLIEMNKIENLPRIGFMENKRILRYTRSSENTDESDYGIAEMPNLKHDKISEIRFIDEQYSQTDLLNLLGKFPTNDDEIDKNFIKKSLEHLIKAYRKLDMRDPSFGATIEFNGFPDFSILPSIEQGMESFSVSISEGGINFSLNMGNDKRNKEKLEHIFRLIRSGENMVRDIRTGSKIEKFSIGWKAANRV